MVITSLLHKVGEICAFLGYYVEYIAISLPMFRDKILFPTSRVKNSKNTGPIFFPETSVSNYNYTLSNNLEDGRSVWIY